MLNHPFDVRACSLYQKQFFTSSHPKVEYHPYLTIYRNIILDFKLFINFFTYNIKRYSLTCIIIMNQLLQVEDWLKVRRAIKKIEENKVKQR